MLKFFNRINSATPTKLKPVAPVDIDEISHLLQCPACFNPLKNRKSCNFCGVKFGKACGQPILINFEKSIFQPQDFTEPVRLGDGMLKGGVLGTFIAKLTFGENRATWPAKKYFRNGLQKRLTPRLLVIGGGTATADVWDIYNVPNLQVVGVDIYPSYLTTLICDGHSLPFKSGSFDGVLVLAVLEHVLEPHIVVSEIFRVLKDDGLVLAETPFMQQVHMEAYDFSRFSFAGHRWLFRHFTQIDAGLGSGPGIALLWSIAHMWRSMGFRRSFAAILTAPFFWLRILDRFVSRGNALDGGCHFYFLGQKAALPLAASDMPKYFRAFR